MAQPLYIFRIANNNILKQKQCNISSQLINYLWDVCIVPITYCIVEADKQ